MEEPPLSSWWGRLHVSFQPQISTDCKDLWRVVPSWVFSKQTWDERLLSFNPSVKQRQWQSRKTDSTKSNPNIVFSCPRDDCTAHYWFFS